MNNTAAPPLGEGGIVNVTLSISVSGDCLSIERFFQQLDAGLQRVVLRELLKHPRFREHSDTGRGAQSAAWY